MNGPIYEKLCHCGSDRPTADFFDARGLFLTRACPECKDEKLGQFRPEVLNNSNYDCDEAIEED